MSYRSSYKQLGAYIRQVNERNTDLKVERLLGVSIRKVLMPSIANTVGTNMKSYKIIKKNQFAYGPVTSRNGEKISVALLQEYKQAIVSQAYTVFEIINMEELDPEYLMMWFRRPEFDRYARYKSHGSARETFDWDELCETELPIPSIKKQRQIVAEYNAVDNRIRINEQLNQKLEETAQAIYKHWFVDFEFPHVTSSGVEMPYKSSGGAMVYNDELDKEIPEGWEVIEFQEITDITSGKTLKTKSGDKYPVYGAGGITGYTNVFLYESTVIIIGRVGTHGKVFIEHGKSWPTDNTLVFLPKYLYYSYFILKNLNYDELNKGGVQALLTQTDLKQHRLVFPKIGLGDFEKKLTDIFRLDKSSEIKKMIEIKDLLLSKMSKVGFEKEIV